MASPVDHIRKHIEITDEMEQSLHAMMHEERFKRGATILERNNLRALALYIKKGSARAFYINRGKDHTYSFAFDDEFVTIPMSLFKIQDATVGIEFLEPTDVVFIPMTDMRTVLRDYGRSKMAEVASYIISVLTEHSQEIEERLLVFQSLSAAERYQWFVDKYPSILERATITQIASFLGITKETLYRIRSGKY